MKRKHKKLVRYIITLILIISGGTYLGSKAIDTGNPEIRCVDGDTFWLGKEKIRLLAIDAPEIAHGKQKADPYGDEASEYTCELLQTATQIKVDYDTGNTEDKYGRKLYWVYIDDKLLQETLLQEGYAKIKYVDHKTINPIMLTTLEVAETKAKVEKLRIWE